jgi:type IV pilus assembly protein PilA
MEERDEGFTLIELLVVIIIIGILAAIAIPVFLSQRNKGYDSQAKSDTRNLATLEETYFNDNNRYTATIGGTGITDYKKSGGVQGNPTLVTYSAVGATPTQDASGNGTAGFCVAATSQSGSTFVYESWAGGLQPNSVTACP